MKIVEETKFSNEEKMVLIFVLMLGIVSIILSALSNWRVFMVI